MLNRGTTITSLMVAVLAGLSLLQANPQGRTTYDDVVAGSIALKTSAAMSSATIASDAPFISRSSRLVSRMGQFICIPPRSKETTLRLSVCLTVALLCCPVKVLARHDNRT